MFECILSEIDRYEVAWKSQICDVVVFSEKFFFLVSLGMPNLFLKILWGSYKLDNT